MPELPEVETIRRGLESVILEKIIVSIEVKVLKLFRGNKALLVGQKVVSVSRRAKLLIIKLTNCYLVVHLKMTGQLIFVPKSKPKDITVGGHPDRAYSLKLPHEYTHIIIQFNNGALYYNDLRKFGWMAVCESQKDVDRLTADLGPEYNSTDFTHGYLTAKLTKRPKAKIKQVLLDQKTVAGLGNIYTDEALFCAKVLPNRLASSLKKPEVKKLYGCIPKVLKEALKHGGSTLKDYRHVDGGYGSYLSFAKVYGRAKQPCKVCGSLLETTKVGARTATYCPKCQR